MALVATSALAAPPLFTGNSESKWSVTKGGKPAGTITLLTSSNGTRAEFKGDAHAAAVVLIGAQNKVWLRTTGGDTELAPISATTDADLTAPALLLPITISGNEKVETKDGKPSTYAYRGAKASYTFDAKGASKVDIKTGSTTYVLTRTSLGTSNADVSTFRVRPRQGAASKLARLSGDLLGSSDSSVSATAGGRGASGSGLKLNDGGDYDALAKLETRDDAWRTKLDAALDEFQKDGKVGRKREEQ